MMSQWIAASWGDLGFAVAAGAAAYLGVIIYFRVVGIRSTTQLEGYDFAATVAIGTILGSVAIGSTSLAVGLVAVGVLLGAQTLVGLTRRRLPVQSLIDHQALVLVKDGVLVQDSIARLRLTDDDVRSLLRREGIWSVEEAGLVVVEATGDVSVLPAGATCHGWIVADLDLTTTE